MKTLHRPLSILLILFVVTFIPFFSLARSGSVRFTVMAPVNIPAMRKVKEIFPLRNYVFFDIGSAGIPDRYVLLTKEQVKDFREEHLELFPPRSLTGRSSRQMIVYYNILNLLGDRMGRNPSTTITLSGASMEGPADGESMAGSIKHYLVNVFGIDAARISTEGRVKPRIPSEQPGGTKELDLLREGDRRVSIRSMSPALLMEFQSGENAPLKTVEIIGILQAPVDSYINFNVTGARENLSSWSLEIRDEQSGVLGFGPYSNEQVSIPGKIILGNRPEGNFKVTMTGLEKSGAKIKKDTTVHMVLWTPPESQETTRFSILYEFNESKAIPLYEKYLTDIVVQKIPAGSKVIIHGYTDLIGDSTHNQTLSLERANDVRNILVRGLSEAKINGVQFEAFGFGGDQKMSPFENNFPEERFYNRTVIIDIIPSL